MGSANTPQVCPFCGQPLVNREAISHLHRAQTEFERRVRAEEEKRLQQMLRQQTATIRKEEREKSSKEVSRLERLAAKLEQRADRAESLAERRAKQIAAAKLAEAKKSLEESARKKAERQMERRERSLRSTVQRQSQQIEELQRRLEHVGAADRGEFNEQAILRQLRETFTDDEIRPVGKGRKGADLIQTVRYRAAGNYVTAGRILYECKDTQTWQNAFITQAKQARETHKTPHVILVTQAFPRNAKDLFWKDGIPVVHPNAVVHLARVVRQMVENVHRAGLSDQARALKTAELYQYLSGEEFSLAMSGIIDTSEKLKEALSEERQWHSRTWARRQDAYDAIVTKSTEVDEKIRAIIERPAGAVIGKVLQLPG